MPLVWAGRARSGRAVSQGCGWELYSCVLAQVPPLRNRVRDGLVTNPATNGVGFKIASLLPGNFVGWLGMGRNLRIFFAMK